MVKCDHCGEEIDTTPDIEIYVQGKKFTAKKIEDVDLVLKWFG